MTRFSTVFLTVTGMLLISCATGKFIEVVPTNDAVAADEGVYRVFLVGDAGENNQIQKDNLELLRARITGSEIPAAVLYLGDNIYQRGVPNPEDSSDYANAISVLDAQIKAVEGITDRAIFIPGNHDWNRNNPGGLKAIRRQDKLIKKAGMPNTELLPHKGCPGPEVVELTDDVVLVIIDSQWWLHDWSTEKDINNDCDIRSRADLILAFSDVLKDYQERQVIVAMHHPMVSAGSHGGYFNVRDHLFPLTNVHGLKHLYLPLPILGSIYPIYRSNFGSVQDIVNHKYQVLRSGLLGAASTYDNVIFVSGHEHTLEYHKMNNQHFIISGAGSRRTDIGKPKTMQFGHGAGGFVQLNLKMDGAVDMIVWEPASSASEPVYRAALTHGVKRTTMSDHYPDPATLPDSMKMAISTRYAKGGLYRFFFGERYRDIYEIPVPLRVLDLSGTAGGLTPVKKGGGYQTNSLRLENPDGKEYTARSMNKDATRILPEGLRNTFASDILQDQFTASHPYGAFVVPKLADRAGVYHTSPELVFMPRQEALGPYVEEFGDQMYLLEERPSGDWSGNANFGNSSNVIGYGDVVEGTMKDYRNRVDQEFVARARLFDMFLGDWDRHDDQWRWATFKRTDEKGKIYRPIPRDRDQVFSQYDGLIVNMARWFTPLIKKIARFGPDIKSIKWFNENARIFDHDFLNALSREEWVRIATEVQDSLTDDIIEQSIQDLPSAVFEHSGPRIIETLKQRRDKLQEFAARYYAELSQKVFLRGTNNADFFEITREPGQTRVEIFDSNKEGDKNARYYSRTFLDIETDEIQIYALEGQDHILINGSAQGGIRVFCVGGEDHDEVQVDGSKKYRNIKVLDTQKPERIIGTQRVNYQRVGDDRNVYERRAFVNDYGVPMFVLGLNPDDGFLIGGGTQWTRHGFQKTPYASRHSLTGFYAFSTQAFGIDYKGEWTDVLGKFNVGVTASYKAPTYVQNFFGFGNDSQEIEEESNKEYYRVRLRNYKLVPFLRSGNVQGGSAILKAGFESYEVEENEGRFVTSPESGLMGDVFDEKQFVVVGFDYQYRVVNNPVLTRRGIDFKVSTGLDLPLQGDGTAHRYLKTSFATYYEFKYLRGLILATRIGAEWNGGDYEFYQGAIIGALENFRGLRKERFVGDRLFYHNTDLRILLTRWHSYLLPAAAGIQLNFDHGRVWREGEDSDTWHYAYGGGIWVSPFQSLLFSINFHKSDVDQQISFTTGFLF